MSIAAPMPANLLVRRFASWLISWLFAGAALAASEFEAPFRLEDFRVQGTAWRYARVGEIEILSQVPPAVAKAVLSSLLRGQRLVPGFAIEGVDLPLKLILVEGKQAKAGRPDPMKNAAADLRSWGDAYVVRQGGIVEMADDHAQVMAMNYGGNRPAQILMYRTYRLMRAQRVPFPDWVVTGLFGERACLRSVIGIPRTSSIQFAKLSWPDPAVEPGVFPADAADFAPFAAMFDAERKAEGLPQAERWKFEFQTALFARWSLFGPAKNGRNRNGYWAFAELARRNGATEAVFRECYGMDWPQACAEMRAYLKPKNLGMLEARLPQVMADVPEVERMEFRDATPEEVRRILGDFHRLRAAEAERENAEERAALKSAG